MIDDSTRPADAGGDPASGASTGPFPSASAPGGSGGPSPSASPPGEPSSRPSTAPAAEEITGDARVDEALAHLADLGDEPGAGHVDAFEHVHRRLHGMLDELARPRGGTPPDSSTAHPSSAEPEASDGQAEQA